MTKRMLTLALAACSAGWLCADPYLESTGAQAVNTGYYPGPTTKVVADWAYTSASPAQQRVFGNEMTGDNRCLLVCTTYINGSGGYSWAMKEYVGNWTAFGVPVNTDRRQITIDGKNKIAMLTNGGTNITQNITWTNGNRANTPIVIFARPANIAVSNFENYGKLKLYSLQIYENNELLHDYRPRKCNGAGVLFDTVTGNKFASGTSTALIASDDCESIDGPLTTDIMALGGNYMPTVTSAGLVVDGANYAGNFIPLGDDVNGASGSVTLRGENTFGGFLSLFHLPKTYSPRQYELGWSKDYAGNSNPTNQVVYELTAEPGATVSFGGGCEDYTGGQRGDVVRFDGNFSFGGNVSPNGNDGLLIFRNGDSEVGSMKMLGGRGHNSRITVDNNATLLCRGDVYEGGQTSGNPFFLNVLGELTIDGMLGMANASGKVEGNGKLNVNKFYASSLSTPISLSEFNIGAGGMTCSGTRIASPVVGVYNGDTSFAGVYSFTGDSQTLRATTTDGEPADVMFEGSPTIANTLVKTGDGALILAAMDVSGITGNIQVNEGVLMFAASCTLPGNVTVANGAVVGAYAGCNAMLANATLASGAIVQVGTDPAGFGKVALPSGAVTGPVTLRIVTSTPPAAGTVGTLLEGANLTPADLANITIEIVDEDLQSVDCMDGTPAIENGNLVFTVTQSSTEAAGDLTWTAAVSTTWDTFTANWTKNGIEATFYPYDNAIFGDVAGTNEVPGAGIDAGDVTFNGNQTYVLGGAGQLRGRGTITVDGGAKVDLATFIDEQEIVVKNGVFRPTKSEAALLGSPNAPITVLDGGTYDINNMVATAEDRLKTFNKKVRIAGEGATDANGVKMGAIVNKGPLSESQARLHTIELIGDAMVKGGTSRIDLRKRSDAAFTGRPQITGPGHTLTAGGQSLCFIDGDLNVKKVVVTNNAIFSLEGSAAEVVPDGILIQQGILQFWAHSGAFTNAIVADGSAPRISTGSGTTTISGPVRVADGSTLNLAGSNYAASKFTGGIYGPGLLKVGGDVQYFASDVEQTALEVTRGFAVYGDMTASGNEKKWPKTVTLNGGTTLYDSNAAYLCFSPSSNSVYSGYTISGQGSLMPSRHTKGSTVPVVTVKDTTIVGDKIGIVMGYSTNEVANSNLKHMAGDAVLGEGFRADSLSGIWLGVGGKAPADATLTIGSGADVTMKQGSTITLGQWSGTTNNRHRIIVDGGNFDASLAGKPSIGYDTHIAEFQVKSGTAKLPGANLRTRIESNNMTPISVHYQQENAGYSYEILGMSGGTLELSGNIETSRFYPNVAQLWLGGGTLKSMQDWSTDFYQYAMFETWGDSRDETKKTFTLDTNGKTTTFRSALQGNANVKITGSGNFVADYNVQGGVTGHWTIENAGTANLKNAAAFAEGLTIADGASATIDIGARTNYASLAVGCIAGNPGNNNNEFTHDNFYSKAGVFPNLFTKNFQKLLTMTSTPTYTAFRQEAEFYVDEADTYTFGVSYDDRGDVVIDGKRVAYNDPWNSVGIGTVALNVGWHRINVTCKDNSGGAGPTENTGVSPDPVKWKAKGMAAGWHKGATTSTSAADYQPIDTTTMKMRPVSSVRWNRRYTNAGTPTNWNSDDTYTFSMVTNSMQGIHDTASTLFQGSLNSYTWWTYVEPEDAGTWTFEGVYDDRINVRFDGKTVFEHATWNSTKSTTAQIDAGWHKVKVIVNDGTGGWSWSGVSGFGAALYVKRPTDTAKVTFDERNIRMTAEPYGFIGGELNVGEGATLTNESDTPCEIIGTVNGTGTIKGKYALTGTWNLEMDDGANMKTVKWSDGGVDLSNGKLNIALTKKRAMKAKYDLGVASGLAGIQSRITTTFDGQPYDNAFTVVIENGKAVLKNLKPANTVLYLR